LFYWLMKNVVLGPVLRLLFRPTVEGIENIPEDGAAILASNHLSFSDSIFLPLVLDRKVVFLAKADYFTKPGAKGKLTALFFKLADQLPIDRSGGRAGDAALRTGMRVLTRGDLLGIYPEGTRSPDGRLYRGKTGVARMALSGLVPVLPVAMIGTDKAQPIGRRLPRIVRIGIKIGEPLDFSRYEGMENDRFILRSITDEIMYRLMELSGQEYVDVYAATMKERLAAARKGKAPQPTTLSGQAPGQRAAGASSATAEEPADEPLDEARDEPVDAEPNDDDQSPEQAAS
jgi:1-acyl-sn-glycerol-3-phosphate acyltransferase